MQISVVSEVQDGEGRVAISPDMIKKYVGMGFSVAVQAGAGAGSTFSDEVFKEAGASISDTRESLLSNGDLILSVQSLPKEDLGHVKRGAAALSILNPFGDPEGIKAYAEAGIMGFAMEFMPRISRAQSMDVLSSQSNLAGYKAVLEATHYFGRAMPMMMTAAGTVAPARVFVMGAGVAGLQAIATAKRLGAIVSATDVRAATKEQVESLGGTFVMVESDEEDGETAAGYAKEMSEDYKVKQAALVADHIAKQDIVITTALIPGRPAPKLVSDKMLQSMKPGSVIVDMAVETGGNVEGAQYGEVVDLYGVTVVGLKNLPSRLAADASSLYAKNLYNFLSPFADGEGTLTFDFEDELVSGTCVTKDGAIVHERLREEGN
ncbi:Re/Si-specific NAD(P)(+) transhydrogenase subunit alpha [Temperatibacter marinus]|uniref:NAD(P) transhydrogenase subunit alpha part 1 n=1 Tax=Temperatibacter marinus TaxID=1456591 RepID=A0AA52EHY3_9PROT|nr:Re/Si-specific NAD(P)(+) transhydrogenase subunit alpha [Temperatibacter marinus]WND02639.1 Re/Si-specific NAD(P)(+) transhydrogenase subunit alpha [Temperatibacter marinus]